MGNNRIILYDGDCAFCNRWVGFVIKHDKKQIFRFASLLSETANEAGRKYNFAPKELNSIILLGDKTIAIKADAVFKIVTLLGFPFSLALVMKSLGYTFNNKLYDFIAKRRNKLATNDVCNLDDQKFRSRLLP